MLHDFLAVLSGGAVGLVLAVIGGGGSILATPLLLYVVGAPSVHAAIGTSALAVSVNAFANLLPHAWKGNVKWPCAVLFGASGVAGAFAGAAVGKSVAGPVLLLLFAGVMVAVGLAMLRPQAAQGSPEVRLTPRIAMKLVPIGLGVGFVSGFFGIGGGFLIVPGLMAGSGMAMLHAVGSSLFSVGAFGLSTAVSYAWDGLVDWRTAAFFIAGGLGGGLVGVPLAGRLAAERGRLQKVFAGVVFAVAFYIAARNLAALLG